MTQWRMCWSSSPSPTFWSAFVTEAIWVSTSMQY